jgi:hypothetical protein
MFAVNLWVRRYLPVDPVGMYLPVGPVGMYVSRPAYSVLVRNTYSGT